MFNRVNVGFNRKARWGRVIISPHRVLRFSPVYVRTNYDIYSDITTMIDAPLFIRSRLSIVKDFIKTEG